MNVTLQQLRVLLQVADASSFTKAAIELHVSQSALSRSVADLERRVDTKVFRRTTRSVDLTLSGRAIVDIAREMVDHYDEGLARIHHVRQGTVGHVRIAAIPSITAILLPSVIAEFRNSNPDIKIEIFTAQSDKVSQLVAIEKADIGIGIKSTSAVSLSFLPLVQDEFVCLLRPSHPISRLKTLSWKQLSREPFLAFPLGSSIRQLTDQAFQDSGFLPETVIGCDDITTAAGLAAAGLGVTAVPSLVSPLAKFAELIQRPVIGPSVVREIGVISSKPDGMSSSEYAFLRCLRTAVAQGQHSEYF